MHGRRARTGRWACRSMPSAGAAGADLRANFPDRAAVMLAPGAGAGAHRAALAVPEGFEVQLRPRSGLALKHGITLPNSPGTIDSDYRGPLGVIVMNAGTDAPFADRAWHAHRADGGGAGGAGRFRRRSPRLTTPRAARAASARRGRLMLLVLVMAAVLWGIGAVMGARRAGCAGG